MQAVYIFRHGEPDFNGKKVCLGKLDLSLSESGLEKSRELSQVLSGIPDRHTFSSPLKRCMQTAEAAGALQIEIRSGFEEIDMGLWDGLAFDEIREKWPEAYEKRGTDYTAFAPPEGETLLHCKDRVYGEFTGCMEKYRTGNIAVFTHNAAAKMLVSALFGVSENEMFRTPFHYCDMVQILIDGNKAVSWVIKSPEEADFLNADCHKIWKEAGTPEKVIKHCEAVAELSIFICRELAKQGISLQETFTEKCALLHDLARTEKHHAARGAELLLKKGYAAAAAVVNDHMELPETEERISEKSVVFLADKLVKETNRVSLETRYFSNVTEDKRPFIHKKYAQACRIQKMIGEYVPEVLH